MFRLKFYSSLTRSLVWLFIFGLLILLIGIIYYFPAKMINSLDGGYGKDGSFQQIRGLNFGFHGEEKFFPLNSYTSGLIVVYYLAYFYMFFNFIMTFIFVFYHRDNQSLIYNYFFRISQLLISYILLSFSFFVIQVFIPLRISVSGIEKYKSVTMPSFMYDLFAYAQKIGGDPSNSFPSGHVAYVLLFALFYHQIRNNLGEKIISYIFGLYFGLNFLSILVCKKHYLFDAISGALLALSIYFGVRKKVTKNIFDFLFLKPSLMKK